MIPQARAPFTLTPATTLGEVRVFAGLFVDDPVIQEALAAELARVCPSHRYPVRKFRRMARLRTVKGQVAR